MINSDRGYALTFPTSRNSTTLVAVPQQQITAVAAALGVTFFVLQVLCNSTSRQRLITRPLHICYSLLRDSVRGIFLGNSCNINTAKYEDGDKKDKYRWVTHKGSCHCDSVYFKVTAPRTLHVRQPNGKIRYPQACVPAHKFRLIFGDEVMRIYHVNNDRDSNTTAYSFCRKCAVHIVNATGADASTISFNINCLHPGTAVLVEDEEDNNNDLARSSQQRLEHLRRSDRNNGKSMTSLPESHTAPLRRRHRKGSELATPAEGDEDEEGDDSSNFPTREVIARPLPLPRPTSGDDWEWPLYESESTVSAVTGTTSYNSPTYFESSSSTFGGGGPPPRYGGGFPRHGSSVAETASLSFSTTFDADAASTRPVGKVYPTHQMRRFMKKHMKRTSPRNDDEQRTLEEEHLPVPPSPSIHE